MTIETKYNIGDNMIERLIICWHVLTMHTYACFFCNKKMTKQRCYEENTFNVFNKAIVDFASNNYDIEAYERSKYNNQQGEVNESAYCVGCD